MLCEHQKTYQDGAVGQQIEIPIQVSATKRKENQETKTRSFAAKHMMTDFMRKKETIER